MKAHPYSHPVPVPPSPAWALFLLVPRKGTALSPPLCLLGTCSKEAWLKVGEEEQPTSRACFLTGLTLAVPEEAPANRARSSRAKFQPEPQQLLQFF